MSCAQTGYERSRWGSPFDVSWRLWRITKPYVTDPDRSGVLVDVSFESLTGRPYKLYALLDPALSNTGDDDIGETDGRTLVARDDHLASALAAEAAPTPVSSGYPSARPPSTTRR